MSHFLFVDPNNLDPSSAHSFCVKISHSWKRLHAFCQCEAKQSIFSIDVVWATPCFAEFNYSPTHDLLAILLRQGIEYFTLLGQWESQLALGGISSFGLWTQIVMTPPTYNPLYEVLCPPNMTSWHPPIARDRVGGICCAQFQNLYHGSSKLQSICRKQGGNHLK